LKRDGCERKRGVYPRKDALIVHRGDQALVELMGKDSRAGRLPGGNPGSEWFTPG
jgi:hypothetical protein